MTEKERRIKESKDRHYQKNKEKFVARNRARRVRCTALLQEVKEVPCADCGVEYPYYVMDLDHRDPSEKVDVVSHLKTYGERTLLAEIAKCDVVCSNCHRIRHAPVAER